MCINSAAENDFATDESTSGDSWIGLNDLDEEGTWVRSKS